MQNYRKIEISYSFEMDIPFWRMFRRSSMSVSAFAQNDLIFVPQNHFHILIHFSFFLHISESFHSISPLIVFTDTLCKSRRTTRLALSYTRQCKRADLTTASKARSWLCLDGTTPVA
jgi:hypothetical protein